MKHWTALLPLKAILQRELVSALRNPKIYLLVSVTVAWASAALLTFNSVALMGGGDAAWVLWTLTISLLGAGLALLTPLTAVSIVREREQDTLPMLHLTLAGPWQFVLGKLLSVLLIYVLMLVAVLPVFGLVFFFVGVDVPQFVLCGAMLLGAGAMNAAIGMFYSGISARSPAAVVGGVITAALAHAVVPIFATMIFDMFVARGGISSLWPGWVFPVLYLLLAWAALYCAVQQVRVMRNTGGTPMDTLSPATTVPAPPPPGRMGRLISPLATSPKGTKKRIKEGWNPIYGRERIQRSNLSYSGDHGVGVAVFIISFLIFLIIGIGLVAGDLLAEPQLWLLQMCSTILFFCAPIFPIHALHREQDAGSRDLLRMTLLNSREIIGGVFMASCARVAPILIGLVAGAAFPIFLSLLDLDQVLLWPMAVLGLVAQAAVVICIALAIAAASKTVSAAMVISYLLLYFSWGLLNTPLRGIRNAVIDGVWYEFPLSLLVCAGICWLLLRGASRVYARRKLQDA